jgi:serine/threonine-protein kinase RsbW
LIRFFVDEEGMDVMPDLLRLTVPGKPDYVGTMRLTLSSIASNMGFDIESIEDIKVAVSEACTNIVCHSHPDFDFTYDVTCEITDDKLNITVEDNGKGYDTRQYVEPTLGEAKEGGLGLFIIKALMDEVEVKSKIGAGTHIRMTKLIHSEGAKQ